MALASGEHGPAVSERGRPVGTNPQLRYDSGVAEDALAGLNGPRRTADPPPYWSASVARVVVDVMPKPEILDPQGQAVAKALPRLGFSGIAEVRQGKRFELEVDDSVDDATLARIAEGLLANPVIEEWTVRRVAE